MSMFARNPQPNESPCLSRKIQNLEKELSAAKTRMNDLDLQLNNALCIPFKFKCLKTKEHGGHFNPDTCKCEICQMQKSARRIREKNT